MRCEAFYNWGCDLPGILREYVLSESHGTASNTHQTPQKPYPTPVYKKYQVFFKKPPSRPPIDCVYCLGAFLAAMPPNPKRYTVAKRSSLGRSSRARSAARASAARRAAPVRAGADDNESEDGRVFEDDLEEGDESDNHGGTGDGKGGGSVGGDGASDSEESFFFMSTLLT